MSSNVLTPEEEKIIRNASIASSCEIDQLLAIIQRLVKRIEWLTLPPRDRPRYSTAILDGSSIARPLFSDSAESEIRRIAREVAREEIQKHKDDEEVPFVHSSECTKRLHGESLAGSLKVRWQQGESFYYDNCCHGEYQRKDRPNAR